MRGAMTLPSQPEHFSQARALAHTLDLVQEATRELGASCMTYACGCVCRECLDLAKQIAERGFTRDGKVNPPKAPPQPWQIAA